MLRRRRPSPDVDSPAGQFAEALRLAEEGKDALVSAVPTARRPGRPLAEALADLEDALVQTRGRMSGWRRPELDPEWEACAAALEAALRGAERLRLVAPELSFEQMAFMIQDLIAPLEAFDAAAERVRSVSD